MAKAILECQFCGTLNSVDLAKHDQGPKCAECSKQFLVDRPIHLSETNFDKVIAGSEVPIIVDFYADWCGPCRAMAPMLDQIAHDRAGALLIAKVNTDRSPTLSKRYEIKSIPYFARFEKGEKVGDLIGAVDAAAFQKFAA